MSRSHCRRFGRGCAHVARRYFAILLAMPVAFAAATGAQPRSFDIPAGAAVDTLKRAAQQGGIEIMFLADTVRGVKTPAVRGEFRPRDVLERMVAHTGLVVVQDEKTGALMIRRAPPSADRPAAPPLPRRSQSQLVPASPMQPKNLLARVAAALAWLTVPLADAAETAAPASATAPVQLSPFEVRTDKDAGYTATNTLAGSRLNTALRDTPASISVFTKEFLDDIGAINVSEALEYSLNGSRDTTDMTGNAITSNDVLLQFRGFTGASLGRNYFGWALSSDSFNIERLDFARGPNSILFGIGGPGGILNTTTKRALIGSKVNEVRLRVASWEDYRTTIDLGRTLVPGVLAARVNFLHQDRRGWREFDRNRRLGSALAVTWRPFPNTEIRFDGEYGDVNQVAAQPWPAQERYQPWDLAGRPLSATFGAAVTGTANNNSRMLIFEPHSGFGPISWFGARVTNTGPASPALGNNTVAITDERILPRAAALSGPGFTGDYYYYNYALFVEQRFGDFAVEAAFNRQSEQREQFRPQVFNDVALRGDPNARLPDGRVNPNAGKLYTDGQLQVDLRDQIRDDYRLTGSYALDLRRHHAALGQHTLAGLLSRRENFSRNDGFNEVNLTPAGDAIYPADLTNANNMIRRRTYIDLTSRDPALRGMHDPRAYPIRNLNGVTAGLARTRDAALNDLSRTDSQMAAIQSRFFGGRFVLTGGVRHDEQAVWGSTADLNGNGTSADDRDPVTRLFPKRRRLPNAARSEGDTRTYGVVFHPTKWLGLFYNNADNFVPQSDLDIFGQVLGNRKGQGEDLGVRLTLLDGRISGTIAHYKTSESNRAVGRDNAFINAINAIWQTLGRVDLFAQAASRDGQDTEGEGWECDFTANPLPNWRVSLNFARTLQVTTNIMPNNGAYVEANRASWQQSATLPLAPGFTGVPATDNGQPSTIATALRTIDALYGGFRQAEGQSRRQLREHTGNVFTSYTLRAPGRWFNGLVLGGGAQYRGEAVVGYDSSRNNAPILGGGYTLVNVMSGYNFRLRDRYRVRLQLNVDNLLDEDDLIVTDADQIRAYRFVYQTPRRWSLTSTIAF